MRYKVGRLQIAGLIVALTATIVAAQADRSAPAATLSVTGDISAAQTFTLDDLSKMPRETISLQEHGGPKADYEGVPLWQILAKAGAPTGADVRGKAMASYVLAIAHDGYQVLFGLAELDPDISVERIIVADKRDGKPISDTQGPLRLVCAADKKPARSVRMLEKIQVVRLLK